MEVVDHFLSKKKFTVQPSSRSGILETAPKPSSKDLPKYYKSKEYLSHNKNGSFFSKLYSLAKRLNFFLKLKHLRKHSSSLNTLLDFGSGDGFFIAELNKNRIDAHGYEPLFNSTAPNTYKQKDLLLSFDKAYFDVITMWHSLEHVESYSKTITFLKPLIKSIPNFNKSLQLIHTPADAVSGYILYNPFMSANL